MYLAQYSYNFTSTSTGSSSVGLVLLAAYLVFILVFLIAGWKIFTKAGEPGWKILIPIYNTITLLRIVGYSGWYVLLFLIPLVNFIFAIIVAYKLAQSFGYGIGMTILEFVLGIGYLIIAFGSSKYMNTSPPSPAGPGSNPPAQPPVAPPGPAAPRPPSPPNLVQ